MSERTYYPINEKTARAAHDMMSFSDYTEGSKTAEYRRDVDRAYDLADRVAAKKPDEAERVYRLAGRYAKKMAEYYNPSIWSSVDLPLPLVPTIETNSPCSTLRFTLSKAFTRLSSCP